MSLRHQNRGAKIKIKSTISTPPSEERTSSSILPQLRSAERSRWLKRKTFPVSTRCGCLLPLESSGVTNDGLCVYCVCVVGHRWWDEKLRETFALCSSVDCVSNKLVKIYRITNTQLIPLNWLSGPLTSSSEEVGSVVGSGEGGGERTKTQLSQLAEI